MRCESYDCAWLFERHTAARDVDRADNIREALNSL